MHIVYDKYFIIGVVTRQFAAFIYTVIGLLLTGGRSGFYDGIVDNYPSMPLGLAGLQELIRRRRPPAADRCRRPSNHFIRILIG
jgi:hypothetical protein